MKKFLHTKKAVALGVIAALAVAVGAYAYFTTSGSGTGEASVGNASEVSLVGLITGTLYPGGAPADVSVLVTNTGSGSQNVDKVHLDSIDSDKPGCDVSVDGTNPAFTMGDIDVSTDLTKSGTDGDHVTKTGTLQMNDTNANQDACQGANLTLHLSSN